MENVQTKTFKSIDLMLDLINGRDDGVPLGWLDSLIVKVRARIPPNEQADARVFGLHLVTVQHKHVLSEAEKVAAALAEAQAALAAVRAALPREDDGATAATIAAIRTAVGG